MTKLYHVSRVFSSWIGEGDLTGFPAVFVRFHGCNLTCSWCDEPSHESSEMSLEDIVAAVGRCIWDFGHVAYSRMCNIVLTGGEPLLQVDDELLSALEGMGPFVRICVETNGTVGYFFSSVAVHLTVSPKPHTRLVMGGPSTVWKIVYPSSTSDDIGFADGRVLNEVLTYITDTTRMAPCQPLRRVVWFQPQTRLSVVPDPQLVRAMLEVMRKVTFRFCIEPRLSCQIHKVLGIE